MENFPGRKLLREKTFTNFVVLWLFVKVFSTKFGGVVSFCVAQASNLWNFSPQKLSFSPICESFLPQKFPAIRYVTVPHNSQMWQSCVKIDYSVAYLIASHYSYLLANMYRYEFNSYILAMLLVYCVFFVDHWSWLQRSFRIWCSSSAWGHWLTLVKLWGYLLLRSELW